jgi:hypothetical protein
MDNTIDQVSSATSGGQLQDIEINLDDASGETAEELRARLAKRDEAVKQLTARAKSEQDKRKALEAELAGLKGQSQTKPSTNDTKVDLDEVTDLRLDGYTRDEVAFIIKNGGRKSLESDPFVKVAIEKIREQKKAENAIPDSDTGKSEIEKKFSQEQLKNMSAEELYKILPKSNR